MGHFSHSVLAKKYQFCIRIRKKWKIWIFEIHYASYILNSKVKFKNHIFQYCLILLQNWYFLAKTEWEKCPISDILDKLTKLFQIRQVCASLCDNKPYPNFVSKVVFYEYNITIRDGGTSVVMVRVLWTWSNLFLEFSFGLNWRFFRHCRDSKAMSC